MDDGYEPARVGPNMHKLTADGQVLAIVGNVGTPTAVVSGSDRQRRRSAVRRRLHRRGGSPPAGLPPTRTSSTSCVSYAEETGAMVDVLIDHAGLRPKRLAFFTYCYAYGDAGFNGGLAALKRRGLRDESSIVHGRYESATPSRWRTPSRTC